MPEGKRPEFHFRPEKAGAGRYSLRPAQSYRHPSIHLEFIDSGGISFALVRF